MVTVSHDKTTIHAPGVITWFCHGLPWIVHFVHQREPHPTRQVQTLRNITS